ncbi:alkaline phosphatase family protein [Oryzihumus sp.]|uniref:alkaline phosphatase family protein n=1 Tax=Oryzihumus sp. TaxID=1968903 RepID=UPI002ED87F4C
MENHAASSVLGSPDAPFINDLARTGASLTRSYAVAHPSQPNYLALFSGSTQGVTSDRCPLTFSGPNLATSLHAAGRTFTGYSEDLPSAGFSGCTAGGYARKHNPWADFTTVPAAANQPMTRFPTDPARLPTVAFVVPNLSHDMHDGSVAEGDAWLAQHLGDYAQWARTHNSALVVTWDEDDDDHANHIATLVVGAHVRPGTYAERADHYRVLRMLTDVAGARPVGRAAGAAPLTGIWDG